MRRSATAIIIVLFAMVGSVAMGVRNGPEQAKDKRPEPAKEATASSVISQAATRNVDKISAVKMDPQRKGNGLSSIERAARAGKYLFVFLYKEDDEQTRKMREVFEKVTRKARSRAASAVVNITEPAEKGIVEKFKLERAPTPLVLVLAPNGAVTGGFPTEFSEEKLMEAFVSPCSEKCLKALQDGKLVLLCVRTASSESNRVAMQGVRDFKADSRFSQSTEIVELDPTNSTEKRFLTQLQVDAKSDEPITVFLAPPGAVIGKFPGRTDKAMLETALRKASSASSGCCPSGSKSSCAPK